MPSKLRDIEPAQNNDPQLGLLLAMFEDGTHEWRREFTGLALPQAAISWRPHEGFACIGNILVQHRIYFVNSLGVKFAHNKDCAHFLSFLQQGIIEH